MEVKISKSTNSKKKYMAVFYEGDKKIKTTHFGCAGMSDFTKHKDDIRRNAFLKRNAKWDNSDKFSASTLSTFLLW